jgi:Tfp pilus assembly major pilin PilA
MKRSGFALIELLLVIGIIGAVTGMAVPIYRDYEIKNDLNLATEQVQQGLARARLLSQSGQNDSSWGFFIPSGTLYKGETYAARDASFDEIYSMPSTITTTGLSEVAYSKIGGMPDSTGAIVLTALNKEQRTIEITVESESVAVVQDDKLTICHYPPENPGNKHSLTLSESAWPAHRDHGDTLGPCPGESSAASSVASSTASSAGAASSASAATCADRFSVAADGTITTTGTVSVTYKVLGSAITYGSGGPEVNVYVSRKNTGNPGYTDLFSGADVDGGEQQIVSGYSNGSQAIVKVRGYFKQKGWLTFDKTYASNDGSGHFYILRNGDPIPNIPAFSNQSNIQQFLKNIIDAQNKISIGEYDVVMLVELGALNTSASDFQDAVIQLQFSSPTGC